MAPFRALLKPPEKGKKIYWDLNLTNLFNESKEVILNEIRNGIKMFKKDDPTYLMTDWSKEGLGYMLMQKRCKCPGIKPTCCTNGWQLILAGSRFCKGAESRYAPVEGEALAISWALHNTRHYTLGNDDLVIVTDHKPLLKVLGDRDIEDIHNPRLLRLKESTLLWKFTLVHLPGKVNFGPDTLSRQEMVRNVSQIVREDEADGIVNELETEIEAVCSAQTSNFITWEKVKEFSDKDDTIQKVINYIRGGFPPERKLIAVGAG